MELHPLADGGEAPASVVHPSPPRMKSAWVAPRDWGFRSSGSDGEGGREGVVSEARGPGYGLGVQGVEDIMARMERLEEQRAEKKERKTVKER